MTPPISSRPPMTIGQVLDALKEEFDDITVSKIRFLESEGLIAPERTPSGYRRFRTDDVERLRLVLRLQRDSFLPLKEIRKRLDAGLTDVPAPTQAAAAVVAPEPSVQTPAPVAAAPQPAPEPEDELRADPPDTKLTESDLADAASLELGEVRALRSFGVICEHGDNGTTYFDHDDLRIAEIARDLLKLGIEARHMKTLRRIAEQEADMLSQVVAPAMRNRRPEARAQAVETMTELAALARKLRAAYVTATLRSALKDR